MFSIKIEFTGGEKTYKFKDDQEILLGKGDNCQVKLDNDGISRNHLKIYSRNGDYFCTDLGSTNGSFINDDRLEPNTEVSFTSFFPIRLGFDVYVNLLDEVDVSSKVAFPEVTAPVTKTQERTNSSIKVTKKTEVTETKRAKPSARRNGKERPEKVMAPTTKRNLVIIVIAIGAYLYFTMFNTSEPEVAPVVATTVSTPAVDEKVAEKPAVKSFELTPEDEALVKNSVAVQKCMTQEEKALCQGFLLTGEKSFPEGVLVKPTAIIYVFNAIKTLGQFKQRYRYTQEEIKELTEFALKNYGPDARKLNFKMTYNLKPVPDIRVPKILSVFEFLYSGVLLLDPKAYEGKSIIFIPITEDKGQYRVIGFFKPNMQRLKTIDRKILQKASKYGAISGIFKDFDDYFP